MPLIHVCIYICKCTVNTCTYVCIYMYMPFPYVYLLAQAQLIWSQTVFQSIWKQIGCALMTQDSGINAVMLQLRYQWRHTNRELLAIFVYFGCAEQTSNVLANPDPILIEMPMECHNPNLLVPMWKGGGDTEVELCVWYFLTPDNCDNFLTQPDTACFDWQVTNVIHKQKQPLNFINNF